MARKKAAAKRTPRKKAAATTRDEVAQRRSVSRRGAGQVVDEGEREDRDVASFNTEMRALRAVEMLMAGATTRQIAAEMGVTTRSVNRWLASPVAVQLQAQAMDEVRARAVRVGLSLSVPAMQKLAQTMNNDRAPLREQLYAANSILRIMGVDRLATGIENAGERRDARESLREKLEAMDQRASRMIIDARAEDADGEGDGLRAVE